MSKGGGKQTTTSTTAQKLDPQSQAFVDFMRRTAMGGINSIAGSSPLVAAPNQFMTGALSGIQGLAGSPLLGNALNTASGFTQGIGANDINQFLNPFMSNVVDATRGEFDFLRNQASQAANQQATQAGAFGGSRHAVLEGSRLGELDRAQASTVADLLNQGFNTATQTALANRSQQMGALGSLAGLAGTQAGLLGQQFGMGEQFRNALTQQFQEPLLRQQAIMQLANMGLGPTGFTSTTKEETQMPGGDPFSQLLGLGLTFGPMLFGAPPIPGMATPSAPAPRMATGFMSGGLTMPGINPRSLVPVGG